MSRRRRKDGRYVGDPICDESGESRKDFERAMVRAFSEVFVLTCFTSVSANDLSNCCKTFIASCGVIAPLVMSSSSESVNAIPILSNSPPD